MREREPIRLSRISDHRYTDLVDWLVKTEPEEYSWDALVAQGTGCWDGVRNVEARNNLRAMQLGDQVLVYHTGKAREIVGVAKVVRTAYPDPTSTRAIWSAVDLAPVRPLRRPVTLQELKQRPEFSQCPLVRRPRLSVMPLEPALFSEIVRSSEQD